MSFNVTKIATDPLSLLYSSSQGMPGFELVAVRPLAPDVSVGTDFVHWTWLGKLSSKPNGPVSQPGRAH